MSFVKVNNVDRLTRVRALRPDDVEMETRGAVTTTGGCATSAFEETAFTRQSDLHSYVRGLSISPEVIEKWISAGLLFPDEIRMAEKIIKILREKIKVS
ncbi:MAG: hypothetical protein QNJ22_05460 [Desulfosarcinaceae bacterium]|nr:hypothetical protein [Desulfosarcinaceae bacterium]